MRTFSDVFIRLPVRQSNIKQLNTKTGSREIKRNSAHRRLIHENMTCGHTGARISLMRKSSSTTRLESCFRFTNKFFCTIESCTFSFCPIKLFGQIKLFSILVSELTTQLLPSTTLGPMHAPWCSMQSSPIYTGG